MKKRMRRYVMAVCLLLACVWGIQTEAAEPFLSFSCGDSVRMTAGGEQMISVEGTDNIIEGKWSVSDPSALRLTEQTKSSVKIKAEEYVGSVTLTYSYSYTEESAGQTGDGSGGTTGGAGDGSGGTTGGAGDGSGGMSGGAGDGSGGMTGGTGDGSGGMTGDAGSGAEGGTTQPGEDPETEPKPEVKQGERSITVFISTPSLSESEIFLSVKSPSQNYRVLTLTGLNENSDVQVSGGAAGVFGYTGILRQNMLNQEYETDIIIGAGSAADTTVVITADGKTINLHVVALSLSFNRTSKTVGDCYSNVYVHKQKAVFDESMSMLALYNGSSASIRLSGSGSYPVQWKSSRSSVASVSGSGTKAVVRGKSKNGYAWITATVAGKLTVSYQVGVASKKAIQTLLRGEKAAGAKYSQPRRMNSGYYDCSSFVWRMYKKSGVKFGVASGWAPTAALEAYYATSHYRILSWSTYDESKLLPGDILFYSSKKNGRYMNITHVAMYIKPGTRIDAHVVPSYHVGERESTGTDVVMAIRPTSKATKKVTSLKAASVKKTSVTLSWSPANSVTGYKIYKYNSAKKKYVLYKKVSYKKDKCKISGLKSGVKYKFKVCAYKGKRNYTAAKLSTATLR